MKKKNVLFTLLVLLLAFSIDAIAQIGPPAPALTYPANGATSLPLTFNYTWATPQTADAWYAHLYVYQSDGVTPVQIGDSIAGGTSIAAKNLQRGTTYKWRVGFRGWNPAMPGVQWTVWSPSATTFNTFSTNIPPIAPSGLTATAVSTAVLLQWDYNTYWADGYYVERSLGMDATSNFVQIAEIKSAGGYMYEDSGLTPQTYYTYRIRTYNNVGTSAYSKTYSIRTAADPPTVATLAATNVTSTGAQLNGTVNPNDASSGYWFEYGRTTNYGSQTSQADAGNGTSSMNVNATLSQLSAGTLYHYRLVATNIGGTTRGTDATFTTLTTTGAATTMALTSGNNQSESISTPLDSPLVVTVRDAGGNPVSGVIVTFAIASAPSGATGQSLSTSTATTGSNGQSSSVLTLGNRAGQYVVTATSSGLSGSPLTFTATAVTSSIAPTVTTTTATSVTTTAAQLNGTVNPNGAATTYYFQYGTTTNYGSQTTTASAGSGTTVTSVSASLSGLSSGTTYHYRLAAMNSGGVSYGTDVTLTTMTTTVSPTVTTCAATGVTTTRATLNGSIIGNGSVLSYCFEYGLQSNYGTQTLTYSVGSVNPQLPGVELTGLTPASTYHYRLVAVGGRRYYGNDEVLTTPASDPSIFDLFLTVTDELGGSQELRFGLDANANDGIDPALGEAELSTSPSSGTFDARFIGDDIGINLGRGSLRDYRLGSSPMAAVIVHEISVTAPDRYTLHWNFGVLSRFSAYMQDMIHPDISFLMNSRDRYTMAGSTSKLLKMTIVYGNPAPTVTTSAATNVTSPGAQLNALVNPNGAPTTYRFEYGTSTAYGAQTTTADAGYGTVANSVNATLTGLSAGTTYHYRIVATNSGGTSQGTDTTFTTLPLGASAPTVTTGAATSISTSSAVLNGVVDPKGAATTYYFQYGTTAAFGAQTTTVSIEGSSSSVKGTLTALLYGTTYYYQLVATNSGGTTSGYTLTFTTLPLPPTVTTKPASNVSTTSAYLNGTVNPNGGITACYYEYGTTTAYGLKTETRTSSSSTTVTNALLLLEGLIPATSYHYRLVATNNGGMGVGLDETFTTLSAVGAAPIVTTTAATNVSMTGAQLNGTVNPNGSSTTYFFEYGATTTYGFQSTSVSAGSGSTASAVNASLTELVPGRTYHYRIVAMNAAGTNRGEDMQFTAPLTGITLTLPTTTAVVGSTVSMPIAVTEFNHIGSFSLTITFDKAVLTYTGLDGAPVGTSATAAATANANGSVAVTWFGLTPLNIGTGNLLNLLFTFNGDSCALIFTNTGASSITDSLANNLPAAYTNGKITRAQGVSVTGTITYATGTAPVCSATVTLTSQGGTATATQTNSTGTYSFNGATAGTYTLAVAKTSGHPTMYTNAADALKAALYPTNASAISTSLAQLAADVNNDGAINAADALQIMLRYVGTLTSFAKGDWIFVPAQSTVTVGGANITDNILAIAVGDVNCDAAPSSGTFFAKTDGAAQSLIPAEGAALRVNTLDAFEVPVRMKTAASIGSMSMAFQFPTESATFVGVRGPEGMVSNASNGIVAVAWFNADNALKLNENGTLVTLRFKPTANVRGFGLTLYPNSQVTDAEGTALSGIRLEVPAIDASIPTVFALGQNYPNPFNPATAISYRLSAISIVTLRVYDILGREVTTLVQEEKEAGTHTVRWDASGLPSGIYMCRLQAQGNVATRKMILTK